MNSRYAHAETPQERIAIAVVAAQHAYQQEFPNGVSPGAVFLEQFLEPFVEREVLQSYIDGLHRRMRDAGSHEMEVLNRLQKATHLCEIRVNGHR